jgi:Beta/Gamma crystallin/Peptidase inhibitor family I36
MHRHLPKISAALVLVAALVWAAGFVPALAQRGFSGQRGATLYSDADFRGSSEVFVGDVGNLSRTRIGNDHASSVRVSPGCRVILYSDANFRGRSMEVSYDVPTLSGSAVGNDSVSSLRVDCRGNGNGGGNVPPPQPVSQPAGGGPGPSGVTLFWRDDFHGRSYFFDRDNPDLSSTPFGNNQASSIIVDERCRVTLYADRNYRGRSVQLNGHERHLGQTSVGDDTVSSIQVSCGR